MSRSLTQRSSLPTSRTTKNPGKDLPLGGIIETERLHIRPLTENDAQAFFAIRSHDEPENKFASVEEAKLCIQTFVRNNYENEQVTFPLGITIKARQNDKIIGEIGCYRAKNCGQERTLEIGFGLAPEYQHKGYATEALQAVLAYHFAHFDIDRIQALTAPDNRSAIALLKRVGMKYEGLLRRAYCIGNTSRDSCIYAVTRQGV